MAVRPGNREGKLRSVDSERTGRVIEPRNFFTILKKNRRDGTGPSWDGGDRQVDDGRLCFTWPHESYDWSKLDLIEFNTVQENTPVVYKSGMPGGISGDLMLSPGDRIEYECEMDNTENFALNFAAKALTGEMCNLFGSFTPGGLWSCVSY